ncbi:DUF5916 domain-containing protein [Marinoscillum furvescens]|uniref:Carbohydrate binding protein with CBM9 domain n=1 Tax=Marinoscillum furvescens DSM 4134 TaxID=1122208 RepID=A0A3D9L7A2_MARFU|nr:DUF5916 domain-containing protein [Marinoscillum furvescens]REE01228.1 carbohydrate binding protein with CBM9 domain [Marinoscillum furvescens DSM 4134]
MVSGEPPLIDGYLDDESWGQVEWGEDFIQRMPDDGAAPSQQTRFKLLYDTKYLYVAIQALDVEPEKIVRRMSRRDGFEGDFVEINIDSYSDKRTAFSFSASASGVKGEEYVSNNGDNWDSTWDPIWYLKTSLNKDGWIAEFKIPLSQLRFADKEKHVWGVQVMRYIFRKDERSYWQPIARDAPGWVHLFGELHGIKGIEPQQQLEIQPYVLGQTEHSEKEEGNPYATGVHNSLDFGVDAKIGLTSDITLDLSINPDFGQVEADPSRVNLSAFQLFFRERRPFFLEGNNILNFDLTNSQAGGWYNNDNLFYSRRIGRRPSYYPRDEDIQYVDRIGNTRILGAAKLTGKNKNGFSWGVLESVTAEEKVEVQDTLGGRRKVAVEPMTNYAVARVQQDINEGNALIGGMITSTNRFINDPQFNYLHDNAYSAGVDFTQNFNDRNYYISLNGFYSHVNGSAEAIERTQRSSVRYFQRPDNRHHQVDTSKVQLNGTGATVNIGKRNGNIVFQTGMTTRSPEVSLNDVGFLRQADYIAQYTWVGFRTLNPVGPLRSYRLNGNQYLNWDYDGVLLFKGLNFNQHLRFNNLMELGSGFDISGDNVSNADLRGGPAIRYPGRHEFWVYGGTNDQKKFSVSGFYWKGAGSEHFYNGHGFGVNINYQPTDALRLSVEPDFSFNDNRLQYVTTYEDDEQAYLLGRIQQTTYSASVRLNYIITPNLSVEYWGQPFISSGEYSEFKTAVRPGAEQYESRFHQLGPDEIRYSSENNTYSILRTDMEPFELNNPNFNVMEFRSNFVIRWEYVPGSTLFLVWTSNENEFHRSEKNRFTNLTKDLFSNKASNIFLIKYTYRFIL